MLAIISASDPLAAVVGNYKRNITKSILDGIKPQLGDSLAGRMQIIHLWPLSQGELQGVCESFIDSAFTKTFPQISSKKMQKNHLINLSITGGYPVLQDINNERMRYDWCNSYLTSIIQKDITDLDLTQSVPKSPQGVPPNKAPPASD